MISTKGSALLFFIIISIIYFGWVIIFYDNNWMRSLAATGAPILIGTLSLSWLFKAYRTTTNNQRYFWLLLTIGLLFYIISNSHWLYLQLTQGQIEYSAVSYVLWLISYIVFIIALIYKIKIIHTTISTSTYIFNIFVFMAFAASVSIHFLINPALAYADYSLFTTITTIAYPIFDLTILFTITILYYLSKHSKEKKIMLFIIVGFVTHVVADSWYAYLAITDGYQPGNLIDFIYIVGLMLIGFAGLLAQENVVEPKWQIKDYFQGRETYFPYLSVIILLILVIQSYQWALNPLSIGLSITFFMIIGRQLFIMEKNKNLANQYKYLAFHDSLTGLKNRNSFKEELSEIMGRTKVEHGSLALIIIDLDRFKNINDTLGHFVGDYILKETSKRLSESLHVDERIYRISGDEFVVVVPNASEQGCVRTAELILAVFHNPYIIHNHEVSITPSMGISIYPNNGDNGDTLLKNADAAMYVAKENGKNNYQFFDSELNEITARKMKLDTELRRAIKRNQLTLVYQPKVELCTGKTIGMEALLRWNHPQLGFISPVEFIPVAEETAQIVNIGKWVLETACKQTKIWHDSGFPYLCVSVNVSVLQFRQHDFVDKVKTVLETTGLSPEFLELEITESIMQNVNESKVVLHKLRDLGVKTSIDDFGTGYSSLHILKELPIDTIKIDKTFIDDIDEHAHSAMVKTIVDLGLNLNLNVVAEGIEYQYQAHALVGYKCGYGQGYLFSKPANPVEFEKYLASDNRSFFKHVN
ncbi:putative bifunctional diguanylate cyclase/phosphodiesterase [Aquibacillus rhizosphaerae]|uniref:EAL domain-containing protein n=1 Tax=Aquibacillus rhizosphaerae TaxID=3051431 RepID=A0ABT7LCH4_9BACI|nr:EAL domain-containing protein [Aquibacillus sp. LR5S19]MDL4842290.1 EAL domain-containing protein [Aquibacillus sp. LR5S19]